MDGTVQPEGIDIIYVNIRGVETFFRMLRHKEFEMSEMSLSSYVATLFQEDPPFIAIPVFTSRFFRHSSIFVNTESGINAPKDMIGKRVGVPEYQITAAVWIRGILSDEYGISVDNVRYFTGGEEEPGRIEKAALDLPPNISVTPIEHGKTLSRMLEDGEIDALYAASIPSTYKTGNRVRRLFSDYAEVEREYFKRTRIFPIMHTFVIRRDVYKKYPWIAQSMLKAMTLAKKKAYDRMYDTGSLETMLPWLIDYVEETRTLMGEDYWPYGFAGNKHTLETFLRYSYEQGLSKRQLKPEELFAPESLESFKL
jgi:4,5-dihydroxyphthalate decarboxylase